MNKETIEKLLKANPYDPRFSLRENEKSRSDVWCKFQVVFFENEQLPFAHCNDCGAILSYSGKIGTASLLRHKCYLLTHFATKQMPGPSSVTVEKALSEFNPKHLAVISSVERTVPDFLISSIAQQQVGFVVRDLQPIDAMEGEGFKSLAQSLINLGADYGRQNVENVLSKRKGLTKTILPAIYSDIKGEIKEALKGKSVALAVEVWQGGSADRDFLTLSAHVINDFKFQKMILGTRAIDRKLPQNLKALILSIAREFLPNSQDVLVNSILVADSELSVPVDLGSEVWILSACHCLNSILDETIIENPILLEVSSVVKACNALVQHFNNSGLNRKLSKPLRSSNLNHWDSVFFMFNDVLKMFTQIQEVLAEVNQIHLISEINLATISSLTKFLEIFKECYESLSREDKPTINEVLLWKYKILRHHLVITDIDSSLIASLKLQVKESFEKRFILGEIHYVALFLDPDFKGMKFLTDTERQSVIDKVTEMIKSEDCQVRASQDEYSPKRKKICKDDRFAEFRDNNSDDEESHVSEIKQYIYHKNIETDILEFWKNAKNFPRLQKLSNRILNIPASSTCCDREPFVRGNTLRERRTRILSDDYDMILFLNQNMKV